MPVANRDSSELTRARRAMTLYAYVNALNAAQATSNNVRREQPTSQTSVVHVEARQGACYCAAVSAGTYILGGKSGPGSCGCNTGL
jgi:uncharacterized low-complexity protein